MLLNSSEATSTAQSTHQIQQDLLEILMAFLKRLRELAERPQQSQDKAASNVDNPSIDHLTAEVVKELVRQQGVVEHTPGGEQQVYRSGSFTLSADLNDGTGYPVYTVTCAERGDLLTFQDSPTHPGDYIFYDTQYSLNPAEKLDLFSQLRKGLESRIQEQEQSRSVLAAALSIEPDAAASPGVKALDVHHDQQAQASQQQHDRSVERVRSNIEALGDLSEPAQNAALIAKTVLSAKDSYEGKHYSVRRTSEGSIELYAGGLPDPAQQPNPLLVVDPNGQVACTSAFNREHAARFEAMHTKLRQTLKPDPTRPQNRPTAPQSRPSKRGGR